MNFYCFNGIVFFKKLYIKAFIVIIDDLKVFLFRDTRLKACIYGSFDLFLKTVFSLMADWNVVSNPVFFMLFHTSSHIFWNVPFFTHLALLDFKLKRQLMRKFLSRGLEKRYLRD